MSNTVEWPEDLPVPLLGRRHTLNPRSIITVMESNRKRVRRSDPEAIELLNVRWNFTRDEFDAFRTFFIEDLEQGVLPFTMVTYDPSPTVGLTTQITWTLAFFGVPPYQFARSDNLFEVSATLEVDAAETEEIDNPVVPDIRTWDPPPVVTYPDPVCRNEIRIDMPTISDMENVVIEHSDSESGPWFFWGETREARTQITLGNYFADRWLRITGETPGVSHVHIFQPDPPYVAPPLVSLLTHPRDSVFPTDHTPTPLSAYTLPYGGGYSGVTLNANIAAVSTSTRTDPSTETEMYRIQLFSDAFVEVGPRYQSEFGAGGSWDAQNVVRITATTDQVGAVAIFTIDGTNPTLLNGYSAPAQWSPADHTESGFVPYVIARCWKDGCPSPPVYIPIDLHQDIHAFLLPLLHQGEDTVVCGCGVFSRTYVNPSEPGLGCNPPTLNFHDTCGDISGDTPCTAPLGAMAIAAAANACAGTDNGSFQAYVLQRIMDGGTPLGFYTAFLDQYYGPDSGACPADFWGGGNWKVGKIVHRLREYNYSWEAEYATWSAYIFFNLYTVVDINGVESQFPVEGNLMPFAEGMTGASGGSTNDLPEKMLDAVAALNASGCPTEGIVKTQAGAGILVSCARAATI